MVTASVNLGSSSKNPTPTNQYSAPAGPNKPNLPGWASPNTGTDKYGNLVSKRNPVVDAINKNRGGGAGGRNTGGTNGGDAASEAERQNKLREVESIRSKSLQDLNQNYETNLRKITNVQDRLNAQQELLRKRIEIDSAAEAKRVALGEKANYQKVDSFVNKIPGLSKVNEIINRGADNFRNLIEKNINPQSKEEKAARDVIIYNENQQEKLNKDIESFNSRYGQKSLSESEYQKAQAEAESLNKRQESITYTLRKAEVNLKVQELNKETDIGKGLRNFAVDVVTLPTETARFGTNVVTRPFQTAKETGEMILALPQEFVERPVTTAGAVGAMIVGGKIAKTGLGKAAEILARDKVKVSISPKAEMVSKDISDTIKIGEDQIGNKRYRTTANAEFDVRDPTTGKRINFVKAASEAESVLTIDAGGNTKVATKSRTISSGKGRLRKYGNFPETQKLTQKSDLTTSKGIYEFRDLESGDIVGRGMSKVEDTGAVNLRITRYSKTGKVRKILNPETSDVYSKILSRIKEQKPTTRIINNIETSGTETTFISGVESGSPASSTLKFKIKLKKTLGGNIEMIPDKTKINARGGFRTKGLSTGKVFEPDIPESLSSSKGPTTNKPATPVDKLIADQLALESQMEPVKIKTPDSQKASLAARADIESTLNIIKSNLERPIEKIKIVTDKATLSQGKSLASLSEKASYGAYTGKGKYELTSGGSLPGEKFGTERPRVTNNFLTGTGSMNDTTDDLDLGTNFRGSGGSKPRTKFTEVTINDQANKESTKEDTTQRLGSAQRQALKQALQIIQADKLGRVKTPSTITPSPPIIKIPGGNTDKKALGLLKIKGLFEVIKKKRGKEVRVSQETDLGKAADVLGKALKGGLEASGFIREKTTGRKIAFGEIANILGKEFRPGKTDITKIVQRKGGAEGGLGRLQTFGEKREIKQARRKKSKKGSWW